MLSRKVDDMQNAEVYEPLKVLRQAIESATEAAAMILRIDDVMSSSKSPIKAPTSTSPYM